MILPHCFTPSWIISQKKNLRIANQQILEKSIHALALLGHLAETELPFVFKGGTSLLLHLPKIRRLSIDIDIVCNAPSGEINRVLDTVSMLPPFSGYSEDSRGERGLPRRRHFKFTYSPIFGETAASHILLDIVEDDCRLMTERKPVAATFFETDRETLVTTLTAESLLADKLTAFAPHTSGVPFLNVSGAAQELQVAKQMFDIGELFNVVDDTAAISTAYDESSATEAGYRGNEFSKDEALKDTIGTSLQFCGRRLGKFQENEDARRLFTGCKAIANHLVNCTFGAETDAKTAASKAACLAAIISSSDKRDFSSLRYRLEEI